MAEKQPVQSKIRQEDERDRVPMSQEEYRRRSADRNLELRPPINRHAHDDRGHRG